MDEQYDDMYYLAEIVQIIGSYILLRKLKKTRNCAGVSLKMQEMVSVFVVIRMFCECTNFSVDSQARKVTGLIMLWMHFILDSILLYLTLTIIYLMRTSLKNTYIPELDPLKKRFLLIPCIWLALLVHPGYKGPMRQTYSWWYTIVWATGVYCETIAVLPQMRMLQYSKMVESSTAHYVFFLGVSRFLVVVHWGIQFIEENSYLWRMVLGQWMFYLKLGPQHRWVDTQDSVEGFWPTFVLLSEVLQSFLFVDFSFYYVANLSEGGGSLRLPSGMTV